MILAQDVRTAAERANVQYDLIPGERALVHCEDGWAGFTRFAMFLVLENTEWDEEVFYLIEDATTDNNALVWRLPHERIVEDDAS